MSKYLSVAGILKSKGALTIDVGNNDTTYWNGICGDNYTGRVITGYHSGINSSIVTIGASTYTIQLATEYLGGVARIRTYYSDGSYWSPWKKISFSD